MEREDYGRNINALVIHPPARSSARSSPTYLHDLRHTFASWAIERRVTPPFELKDLLGHSSLAMVKRYAHLAPEHLRTAAALDGLLGQDASRTQEIHCADSVSGSQSFCVVLRKRASPLDFSLPTSRTEQDSRRTRGLKSACLTGVFSAR
jgi:hypothetical protein